MKSFLRIIAFVSLIALFCAGCVNEDPVSNAAAGKWLCEKHKGVQSMNGEMGDFDRSATCKDGTIWNADLYYHGEGDTGKEWDDPSTITARDGKKAER